MLDTKFSQDELTQICQIMKRHGADCATLVDILKLANTVASNDSIATFKHVRLMKEFGILQDRNLLCHTCVTDVVNLHDKTCKEHEERMQAKYFFPCPEKHYDYNKCEPSVWMVDHRMIKKLENDAAEKDWEEGRRGNILLERGEPIFEANMIVGYEEARRRFDHAGRAKWLENTFPDIDEHVRHNPWMGFFCEKHVGSMRPYSNRIMGYR